MSDEQWMCEACLPRGVWGSPPSSPSPPPPPPPPPPPLYETLEYVKVTNTFLLYSGSRLIAISPLLFRHCCLPDATVLCLSDRGLLAPLLTS